MTVRLALYLGIESILDVAHRFEVYDALKPMFSAVLGARETTLDRLVNAYAMLVNGGKRVRPAFIERIQDRKGRTIYKRDKRPCLGCMEKGKGMIRVAEEGAPPIPADNRQQVVDPRHAYQLVSMMEGVVQRGTATKARKLKRPVAGKTGTTNDYHDAWFVGYTPDLVVGVYVGHDKPKSLGRKGTGGGTALPAFVSFMEKALEEVPSVPFRIPEGISLIKLDRNTGQPPNFATESRNIILEAFTLEQTPGSSPVMDVSLPSLEGPVFGDEQLYYPDETWEDTTNAFGEQVETPNVTYEYYTPEQVPNKVQGTGGLY